MTAPSRRVEPGQRPRGGVLHARRLAVLGRRVPGPDRRGADRRERHLPGRRLLLQPRRLDVDRGHDGPSRARSSAVVLFVGTLLFAVSLVAAFAEGLTPAAVRQLDLAPRHPRLRLLPRVRAPGDAGRRARAGSGVLPRRPDWWIVAVNQLGSVLFFLAGLAAFVRPATSEAINVGLVNWGTFAGAACFAIAGIIQLGGGLARRCGVLRSPDDQFPAHRRPGRGALRQPIPHRGRPVDDVPGRAGCPRPTRCAWWTWTSPWRATRSATWPRS